MRPIVLSVFLLAVMASFGNGQNPFNLSRNQTNIPIPTVPTLTEAVNKVLGNLLTGAQTAVKNLLSKNLQSDQTFLRSGLVNGGQGSRDLIEVALEKIVDRLNFQFYKAHSNATYDPIREHVDYFRLPLNDKMAVLMENVYNSTLGAIYTIDHNLRQTPKAEPKEGSKLEAQAMNLFNELFEGLGSFFQKFKNRNCIKLEWYQHKVERIEHELKKVGEKILHLKSKQKYVDSDETEEIEAHLRKLGSQFEQLTQKLFKIIDEFFYKNSHIHDSDFCIYKKAYEKLKWEIVRVLKELKEAGRHEWRKERDNESREDSSSSSEESGSREWPKEIESKRDFKRVVKHLLKNIDEYYRKCIERRRRELNDIKKDIYRIKFELIKLLKKVELESDEDSGSDEHRYGSDESSEEKSWEKKNRRLIWKFKNLAKKFFKLKLKLEKLVGKRHEKSGNLELDTESASEEESSEEGQMEAKVKLNVDDQPVDSQNTTTRFYGYGGMPSSTNPTSPKISEKAPFINAIKKYLQKN